MKKQAIRSRYLKKRCNLSLRYKCIASKVISELCYSYILSSPYNIVALYFSLVNECDTKLLIFKLLSAGKIVLLPKIGSSNNLIFTRFDFQLIKGKFSMEPISDDAIQPEIVIMPLVAYDSCGNRLGYGKGYYDKALAKINVARIGIAFSKQKFHGTIPSEQHDIPLNAVITELGIEFFKTP